MSRRKRVACAATQKWPGNNIPIFKNNPVELAELERLVTELVPTCRIPGIFDEDGIRKHVMSTFNERCRNVKKGYDYEAIRTFVLSI